jgi:hypothetical protein
MPGPLIATLALALAASLPTSTMHVAPAVAEPAPDTGGYSATIDAAEKAWNVGDYSSVRALLEPIVSDPNAKLEPAERETILPLLADAWLGDKSLDSTERKDQAATYINRLMKESPEWKMPRGKYSPELFELAGELAAERAGREGAECQASLVVCKSDLAGSADELAREKRRYAVLEARFNAQEVEVREKVARTRVLAAIPLGFGHFYNGDRALGGSFLAAEAILAGAGIGLLIQRSVVDGCRRTRGFQAGSLSCDPRGGESDSDRAREDAIVRRRQGEEVVAWMLLGIVAADIIVAQIRFKPSRTKTVDRKPRSELDAEGVSPTADARRPRKATPRKPRASLRAAPTFTPRSVGAGLQIRF